MFNFLGQAYLRRRTKWFLGKSKTYRIFMFLPSLLFTLLVFVVLGFGDLIYNIVIFLRMIYTPDKVDPSFYDDVIAKKMKDNN